MRRLVGLGLGLVIAVGGTATSTGTADAAGAPVGSVGPMSAAAGQRVLGRAGHAAAGKVVVVRGRTAKARGVARIQRHHGKKWTTVARAKVRKHRYAVRVRQVAPTARYRAVLKGRKSRPVTVRVPRPATRKPAPTSTPTRTTATPTPTRATPTPTPTPAQTSPTTGPSTGPCGGVTVRKADGTRWVCTFDDEFEGTALDRTKWMPQTSFATGTPEAHACYRDDPRNVSVGGGTLNLTVRKESTPIPCVNKNLGATADYSAATVATYRLFSQRYGRFEVRMKVQAASVPGLQETFWLWPDDREQSNLLWPAAGEMDVAETYSQYPTLNVPFLHYTWNDNGGAIPGLNTSWTCAAARGVYNTYVLEWTPTQLRVMTNGRTCLVNTSGDVAFQRSYILAFTAALGTGANALAPGTPIPATMNVDYVRVWR